MGAKQLRPMLTDEDVMAILKRSKSYIDQRTGPNATREPRIPTVPNMKPRRFYIEDIQEVFFDAGSSKKRSLKTKKVEKNVVTKKLTPKGAYKPLW